MPFTAHEIAYLRSQQGEADRACSIARCRLLAPSIRDRSAAAAQRA